MHKCKWGGGCSNSIYSAHASVRFIILFEFTQERERNFRTMPNIRLEDRDFAFRNRLTTFSIVNEEHIDVEHFFEDAFEYFESRTSPIVQEHFIIKVGASFVANFVKTIITDHGEEQVFQKIYLNTRAEVADFDTDLKLFYDDNIVTTLSQKIDDIQLRGSGFSLSEIIELNIQLSSFDPCSGSSYIPLPKFLQSKHAIINVRNKDDQCFKYAVLSALFPVEKNAERVSHYVKHAELVNFTNIKFPVDLKQITKFEEQNPSISINVYMFEEDSKKVRPLRLSKNIKVHHIHLLLLTEKTDDDAGHRSHYCWIKNLSFLLSKQVSAHNGKSYFCDRCLNHFTTDELLKRHLNDCLNQNEYEIEMPTFDSNILEFLNHKNQLQVPFIVYADVESLLKKTDAQFCKTGTTTAYQQHEVHVEI